MRCSFLYHDPVAAVLYLSGLFSNPNEAKAVCKYQIDDEFIECIPDHAACGFRH
jgi:hypothetical protein